MALDKNFDQKFGQSINYDNQDKIESFNFKHYDKY